MRLQWLILILIPCSAQAQSVSVKGTVRSADREDLPLAHIIVFPDSITSVSDTKGRFSFTSSPGQKTLIISYTGFSTLSKKIVLKKDTTIAFELAEKVDELNEIVVTGEKDRQQELFESTRTSTNILTPEDITSIPVLGGEADLIKVLQLMPGTIRGIEGSSDLFVRGGAADQNLVLLDGTTVYNTSHLLGFVSVFNPDILESVESINGGFPANYGGRLSSILNVKTNDNIAESTSMSGDIGLVASRLYIDQPLLDDKVSMWISGRRTYIDRVVKLVGEELPYFFYDVNAKLIAQPSVRDKISLSYYSGEDVLNIFRDRNNDGDGFLTAFRSGNNNQALQWTHQLPQKWYTTFNLNRTAYTYDIENAFEDNRLLAFSRIHDLGAKITIANDEWKKGAVKFGADYTRHDVSPSVVSSSGTIAEFFSSSSSVGRIANEAAVFATYERGWGSKWITTAGMRFSAAVVAGKTYSFVEPRFSARYSVSDNKAVKFSYSRMAQYLHRVSNSAVTSPTDIWYPVTRSIGPQSSHQFSAAWQQTIPQHQLYLSAEAYYKPMSNLVGLKEGTNLFFNTEFESSLIQGKGRAYGLELLIRKNAGRWKGWISYSLAWSRRQFNSINEGDWFPSRYDRRHNGAIVAQYSLHPRWALSGVWEFISGSRFTPVIGQYQVLAPSSTGINLVPVFASINSIKLADSHRLDLGIKFKSKPGRKFQYEWFAGVYNVYNRTNPVAITIETNEEDGSLFYEQPGLLGLLPFISYGFKF